MVLGVGYSGLGDFYRVFRTHLEHRNPRLISHDFQLLDSGGTVNIAGYQQRPVALAFQKPAQLGGMGGFTGALQSAHHKHKRRLGGEIQAGVGAAHQLCQLLVNNLDNHLSRSQAFHHLRANSSFGHLLSKILGNLIVNVRFQQRQADFTHRFLYIGFGQLSLTPQPFKGYGKLFRKPVKSHKYPSPFLSVVISFILSSKKAVQSFNRAAKSAIAAALS